jgi:hypothetical protein
VRLPSRIEILRVEGFIKGSADNGRDDERSMDSQRQDEEEEKEEISFHTHTRE